MAPRLSSLLPAMLLGARACAGAVVAKFNSSIPVETRSLEELHQAALAEGGVVTLWHGGDEVDQQNGLKEAFEARFPGMTLNVTVDLSKYHDAAIDEQLEDGNVYVDSVMLQTLHDFPRWRDAGALLNYAPAGFDQIVPEFKDAAGAFYGVNVISWSTIWNPEKLPGVTINEWDDFLKPELKNKLVLAYPNDDDAVLWAFDLV